MKYLPWAFTEPGIYMLMTVLKGELAITQSIELIRVLQKMKDYIAETQGLVTQRDLLRLSMQTNENTEAIHNIHSVIEEQQRLLDTLYKKREYCKNKYRLFRRFGVV